MTTLNQARPKREDMAWGAEGDLGGYNFTPQELETATFQETIWQGEIWGDWGSNNFTPQELETATAQYHMYKDMSAMAARIDQLLAENDRLQRALTKEST